MDYAFYFQPAKLLWVCGRHRYNLVFIILLPACCVIYRFLKQQYMQYMPYRLTRPSLRPLSSQYQYSVTYLFCCLANWFIQLNRLILFHQHIAITNHDLYPLLPDILHVAQCRGPWTLSETVLLFVQSFAVTCIYVLLQLQSSMAAAYRWSLFGIVINFIRWHNITALRWWLAYIILKLY